MPDRLNTFTTPPNTSCRPRFGQNTVGPHLELKNLWCGREPLFARFIRALICLERFHRAGLARAAPARVLPASKAGENVQNVPVVGHLKINRDTMEPETNS